MENVLQEINKRFISLPDEDVRRNNKILDSVLTTFVDKMKTKDPLFKAMFRRVFYGGSYYDGLRVGKPEEFDLDLLLDIPTYAQPVLMESNIPGFVHLQLKNFDGWMKQPEAKPGYTNFKKLFDDKFFLSTEKALAWMHGVIQKTFNDFPFSNGVYTFQNQTGTFKIKFSSSGPALTLHIAGAGVKMDVDFVTCFVFSGKMWPINGFKSNPFPSTKPEFFIVPKKPKAPENQPIPRYWRLSFQEQERALMEDKRTLKPTIKLLKKLRDNQQQSCIASYYIKTVLLHIMAQKEIDFWRKPLSHVFFVVLEEYKEFIKEGKIPYYWNKKNNLIGKVNAATLQNVSGRLTTIIKEVKNFPDKPEIIAKYLLTKEEYRSFIGETASTTGGVCPQPTTSNDQDKSSCLLG
ncbi:hypothetical protein Zmor_005349 [Zophobas morio]|uniref:Cyclic GMP-AMP synthase n=1 Tax=Zophobas morio TaxID=2755281 RepID=A0AA38MMG3_9CUCU|nr:hypothetical protein Zmor_005349 [Zophobas morio]